jgi:hypothetical protein
MNDKLNELGWIGGKIYYKVSDIQELLNGNVKIKI